MLGAPWKGYYLTAYGIAVKHGFVGTEEEWLASLEGKPGAKAQLRYNSEADTLEWKTEEDEAWAQLMSLSELQTELEAATIAEAKAAAESAETAMETAVDAAKAAAADAKKAEAAEKNVLQNILQYGSVVSGAYVLDGKLYIATSDGKVLTAGKVVPEKGVDYWTEEDAAGIAEAVGKAEAAQQAAEDAAEKAAEEAAEAVLEKIQFTDGGTVELTDYAKKEYVDNGDTALREYYDEPKKTNIGYFNREEYFTINADTWDNMQFEDYFAYRDLEEGTGTVSVTACRELSLSGNMTVDYMGAGEGVIFSMAVNGETVKKGEVTTGGKAEFALEVKKGDVLVFEVKECTWNTMAMLTIEATEIYKLQTARDIIAEGVRNKIFTLTGDGYTNTLNPPEGYEDFFQSHEVYEGLILPTMITSLSYIYNAEFRITDGKECNSIRNAPDEDTALANKTFGLLVCTSHTSNEMDYDVWQFVELYPNLLRFIDGESFKSKAESAISTLLRYAENSDLGLDLAESSFEVTYGWEYAEKGKSFIFTPTSVEHAGATAAGITLYYSELGSDTKRYYIKEYDSDGNLVDPTLVAGKPVLLVNNGTYLIAVR